MWCIFAFQSWDLMPLYPPIGVHASQDLFPFLINPRSRKSLDWSTRCPHFLSMQVFITLKEYSNLSLEAQVQWAIRQQQEVCSSGDSTPWVPQSSVHACIYKDVQMEIPLQASLRSIWRNARKVQVNMMWSESGQDRIKSGCSKPDVWQSFSIGRWQGPNKKWTHWECHWQLMTVRGRTPPVTSWRCDDRVALLPDWRHWGRPPRTCSVITWQSTSVVCGSGPAAYTNNAGNLSCPTHTNQGSILNSDVTALLMTWGIFQELLVQAGSTWHCWAYTEGSMIWRTASRSQPDSLLPGFLRSRAEGHCLLPGGVSCGLRSVGHSSLVGWWNCWWKSECLWWSLSEASGWTSVWPATRVRTLLKN